MKSVPLSACLVQRIILFILFNTLFHVAQSQNANYRAQGNYYTAREAFYKKDFEKAIEYIEKAKVHLGGTNMQLQYLHVMALYEAKRYAQAKDEMELFFKIQSKEVKSTAFDKSVEQLTDDEVKKITMVIDKIDEGIEAEKAEMRKREVEKQRLKNDAERTRIIAEINRICNAQSGDDYINTVGVNAKNRFYKRTVDTYEFRTPLSFSYGKYFYEFTTHNHYASKGESERVPSEGTFTYVNRYSGFNLKDLVKIRDQPFWERSKYRWIILELKSECTRYHNDRSTKTKEVGIVVLENRPEDANQLKSLFLKLKELDQY